MLCSNVACLLYFQIKLKKNPQKSLGNTFKQFGPDQADILLVLILVQTVCKGYRQTTKSQLARRVSDQLNAYICI